MTDLRELFDLWQLKKRCGQTIEELFEDLNGKIVKEKSGIKKFICRIWTEWDSTYAFKDNGSNILAVAHCDTVRSEPHFAIAKLTEETLIFSAQLDDRLGVYTVLDFLPKLGINCDVLLTDGEERGRSSAKHFQSKKQYDWIVEFDRRGEDAVVYDFDGFKTAVSEFFKFGHGSYSDISSMEHLGCCGVNIGVGYHNEHDARCYMVVEEYLAQMEKFILFHQKNKNTFFKHEESKWKEEYALGWEEGAYAGRHNYQRFDWKSETIKDCPVCGKRMYENILMNEEKDEFYCPECDEIYPVSTIEYFSTGENEKKDKLRKRRNKKKEEKGQIIHLPYQEELKYLSCRTCIYCKCPTWNINSVCQACSNP